MLVKSEASVLRTVKVPVGRHTAEMCEHADLTLKKRSEDGVAGLYSEGGELLEQVRGIGRMVYCQQQKEMVPMAGCLDVCYDPQNPTKHGLRCPYDK